MTEKTDGPSKLYTRCFMIKSIFTKKYLQSILIKSRENQNTISQFVLRTDVRTAFCNIREENTHEIIDIQDL